MTVITNAEADRMRRMVVRVIADLRVKYGISDPNPFPRFRLFRWLP